MTGKGLKESVWYWPKNDQILRAVHLNSRLRLMFFSETWYYYNPISEPTARKAGMVKL